MESFNELPFYVKAKIVFQDAEFIGCISYYNQTVILYQLDKYFFEVFYEYETNKLNDISLANNKRLHLYCPQLEILQWEKRVIMLLAIVGILQNSPIYY